MVSLKILLFLSLFLLSSCAKLGYIYEQGTGQFSLLLSGVDNESLLKDPKVKDKHKEKVRKIIKYKKYFYEFFEKKTTNIYTETTILEGDAVTYLVITAPFDKIKAEKECFIFVGCFPYLGFFKLASAKEYAKSKSEEGFVTYIRPVYAYSTLGAFEDNILSSFFYYDDIDLAELVFHELFHTIFFVKDEVDLNENLANHFGQEMVLDYFKLSHEILAKRKISKFKSSKISSEIVKLTKKLQKLYTQKKPKTRTEAEQLLKSYLKSDFVPTLKQKCEEQRIKEESCFALKREWNNASLAAFLTYEKSMDKIRELQKSKNLSLKDFFGHIESSYETYRNGTNKESFEAWLINLSDKL